MEKVKVIATIGPGSNKPEILEKLKDRGVSFFRINLSHTDEEDIEKKVKDLLGYNVPIILDTEGSQVRTGNTKEIDYEEGSVVNLYGEKVDCDSNNIFLNPLGVYEKLREGDLISMDFNSALFKVFSTDNRNRGYIECKVLIGGIVGGKKAVQVDSPTFELPPFSTKDHEAIKIAKKYGINHFTLSFMESKEDVKGFRKKYPEATVYSKIESKKGLDNFIEIAKESNGILIDRGDLSSQVSLEKIPLIQKFVINKVREIGKEVFVATNTLEQMSFSLKPNRAEVNDIMNTILDGATGIALTKEVAVGKYPVETVNMIFTLINQIDFVKKYDALDLIKSLENSNYAYTEKAPELLVKPHGGKLVNRFFPEKKIEAPSKKIEIDLETLMGAEQIAIGAFSPLEGFMESKDFHSVVNEMRLSNGTVWPLPIVLEIKEELKNNFSKGDDISLEYQGNIYAILHLKEIFEIDKKEVAQKIYGTIDEKHPGVKKILGGSGAFAGGTITLLKRRNSEYKIHELTPRQTRKIFAERGWSKVLGFHTRNVIHRSHEFIQREGMKKSLCDGLFIHPVIGKKKVGDFEADVIIEAYEKMMQEVYPKSEVLLGTLATYSRYAGPREALFTALIRKNFGCTHIVIGRDHTGVGNFYGPNDSHNVFDKFSKEELGIEPIKFDNVFYSILENKFIHEPESINHPEDQKMYISGTQAREMLKTGKKPPAWFMRPEISKIIIDKINDGQKVFVE